MHAIKVVRWHRQVQDCHQCCDDIADFLEVQTMSWSQRACSGDNIVGHDFTLGVAHAVPGTQMTGYIGDV